METLNDKMRVRLSKFLSKVLRHRPEEIHLELDNDGWCNLENLVENMKKYGGGRWKFLDKKHIFEVMEKDEKGRFSIQNDNIRAVQGHTNQHVDLKFEEITPADDLYHGTYRNVLDLILKNGLVPMQRHYVHLSKDIETAKKVGRRRDHSPVILKIDTQKAHADGIQFYIAENDVYLAKHIPAQYIEVIKN